MTDIGFFKRPLVAQPIIRLRRDAQFKHTLYAMQYWCTSGGCPLGVRPKGDVNFAFKVSGPQLASVPG